MANANVTRFRPDPVSLAAYGALMLGVIAGCGFGVAVTLYFAGTPLIQTAAYEAPEVCELPAPPDPIGTLIREAEPVAYL